MMIFDSVFVTAGSAPQKFYHPRPTQKNANQMKVVSGCTYRILICSSANSFAINIHLHAETCFVSIFGFS